MKLEFQTQAWGAQPWQLAKSIGPGFSMATWTVEAGDPPGLSHWTGHTPTHCAVSCWSCAWEPPPPSFWELTSFSTPSMPPLRSLRICLAHAVFFFKVGSFSHVVKVSGWNFSICLYPEGWGILWILLPTSISWNWQLLELGFREFCPVEPIPRLPRLCGQPIFLRSSSYLDKQVSAQLTCPHLGTVPEGSQDLTPRSPWLTVWYMHS